MKKIPLTQGKFTLVDDDDFEKYGSLSWHAQRKENGAFYAARGCSNADNLKNRRGPASSNTSGYRGVSYQKSRGNWKSCIHVNGKEIFLGRFALLEDAAKAYADANKKYFGDFGGGLKWIP